MKIAIPDIVSNSYFPAIAAVDLEYCQDEGIDLEVAPIFPVGRAYQALRDGEVEFVATSAHGALSTFPNWQGCKLLCAQSQSMYWFLVLRADLDPTRGQLDILKGLRIGAAPWADDGLKGVLRAAGIDPGDVDIGQPSIPPGTSFGIAMADALRAKTIDGFWANGMAAALAVRSGAGRLVLDIRRGDGPPGVRHFTQPVITTTDALLREAPAAASGLVRAIARAHDALRADPTLATQIAARRFPPAETAFIESLIVRDLPFYATELTPGFVSGMMAFASSLNQLSFLPRYEDIVATSLAPLWTVS
jgi:ABC-type nitrate/sulfonate/bicarbonate transport system substrate-binding protein